MAKFMMSTMKKALQDYPVNIEKPLRTKLMQAVEDSLDELGYNCEVYNPPGSNNVIVSINEGGMKQLFTISVAPDIEVHTSSVMDHAGIGNGTWNNGLAETTLSKSLKTMEWTYPFDLAYHRQIENSLHTGNISMLVRQLDARVLDLIEDGIINRGLTYFHLVLPVNNSTVKFTPYVNALHPKAAITETEEFLSPFGRLHRVSFITSDFKPDQDILVEIGKVEYTSKTKCKKTPLLASSKGRIYSYALQLDGRPISIYKTALAKQTTDPDKLTYTDHNGQQKPVTVRKFSYYSVTDGDEMFTTYAGGAIPPHGCPPGRISKYDAMLYDVTDQVLPLIRPGSRTDRYLRSTV